MNGKGDDRRPTQVSEHEFAANWRRAFGPGRPHKRPGQNTARQAAPAENAALASPQEARQPLTDNASLNRARPE